MKVETYTGGPVETNAYLVHAPKGPILIDAPEGVADWLEERGVWELKHLLLTHGHYDHMFDAAQVKRDSGCQIWIHDQSRPLAEHPETMLIFSPYAQIEAVRAEHSIEEGKPLEAAGAAFETFLCPGHCPGSICFYHAPSKLLFGGDVLFCGGIGRWDLPGGSFDDLRDSIQKKLYRLPDDVKVLPGHGPPTTIGVEKRTNPFVKAV
jgi:glyoxylase-like metal-dependent hydrolase (beta-lactamase superfamily II)